MFQMVADAYFVLSDPERRKEYDNLYGSRSDRTQDPNASTSFFANLANMFMGKAPATGGPEPATGAERPDADGVFADVFEEASCPCIYSRGGCGLT
jgi:curved DNA-binding protein CbpA